MQFKGQMYKLSTLQKVVNVCYNLNFFFLLFNKNFNQLEESNIGRELSECFERLNSLLIMKNNYASDTENEAALS